MADTNGICFTFCPPCSMTNQNRPLFYKTNTLKNVNFSPQRKRVHNLSPRKWQSNWIDNRFTSLRKQPTFGDPTTGVPARNERKNSILMTRHYTDLGSTSDWSYRVGNLIQQIRSTTQIWVLTIFGDPGAVSRVGRKGATRVFKRGRKSPWVPTLTGLFVNGQTKAVSWLGTENALYYCAQSANSFSRVLFVSSYTTSIILPQLPGSFTKLS